MIKKLEDNNVNYNLIKHRPIQHAPETGIVRGFKGGAETDAKSIFMKDNKTKKYFLLALPGDGQIDSKKMRFQLESGSKKPSFASAAV